MALQIADQEKYRTRALLAINQLPPFSPTLNRLLATLADEDVSFGDLATLIEKDTALSAHVLRIVNSAIYAHRGTINSVRHAVPLLGMVKLRNTCLSLSVARMTSQIRTPRKWSAGKFNLHSLATAVLTDLLAQRLPMDYPEGGFTAGLLHAIGKLLIAIAVGDEYDQLEQLYHCSERPAAEVEEEFLGVRHTDLAAKALAHWNIPIPIQEAVARQDNPLQTIGKAPLCRVLSTAHLAVNAMNIRIPPCPACEDQAAEEPLAKLGLPLSPVAVLEEFKAEFEPLRAFF